MLLKHFSDDGFVCEEEEEDETVYQADLGTGEVPVDYFAGTHATTDVVATSADGVPYSIARAANSADLDSFGGFGRFGGPTGTSFRVDQTWMILPISATCAPFLFASWYLCICFHSSLLNHLQLYYAWCSSLSWVFGRYANVRSACGMARNGVVLLRMHRPCDCLRVSRTRLCWSCCPGADLTFDSMCVCELAFKGELREPFTSESAK